MSSLSYRARRAAESFARLPSPALFCLLFVAVALSHLTLLRLPYYWDEGGYYIPAALDFYHRYTLIPEFTNAHPPLPNILLGFLWHVVGYHILATRLFVCAVATAALLAVFRMTERMLSASAATSLTFLVAIYPIWFAQSTLAHADMFAAGFTLWAFAIYLPLAAENLQPTLRDSIWVAVLFSLAALSKETAIVQPASLAAFHVFQLIRDKRRPSTRRVDSQWLATLSFPLLPLAVWYGYHRYKTGFTFGNPEYLRYNATDNFTVAHIFTALRYRVLHLLWQRDIWVPILLAAVCVMFLPITRQQQRTLTRKSLQTISILVLANWIAFSVLGGALLTRYLLPIYVLLLLICVAIWRERTRYWPWLATLSAVSFMLVLWWNPPAAFAPEDNLTYRDMIVLHQEAVSFIDRRYPQAHVLTSWPAAAELFRPDLGYTDHRIQVTPIDNFSASEIAKAEQEPERFDVALVFSKNFFPPTLARYLATHPDSARSRDYSIHHDWSPQAIATTLGGSIVFQDERNGEWVAVIHFPRSYEAQLILPTISKFAIANLSDLLLVHHR